MAGKLYRYLTNDDGRSCHDISEKACQDQPENFFKQILSLSAFKSADGFVDPKLILSWLLIQLGASTQQIGLLVPVREAGALLPQLFIAQWIRFKTHRKYIWAVGSLIQGGAFLGMVLVTLFLPPNYAIVSIVLLLAVMAIARSFCSIAYKDILGKTISKTIRGTASGLSSTVASFVIVMFALILTFYIRTPDTHTILIILTVAVVLCCLAAILMMRLKEHAGSVAQPSDKKTNILDMTKRALQDHQFRVFIMTRSCLVATAMAPPFILMLQQRTDTQVSQSAMNSIESFAATASDLGLLVLASSLSGFFSSFIWGRLADRSSRRVLIYAACLACVSFALISCALILDWSVIRYQLTAPLLLFILMIAHHGVRLGRSTHLVDMADESTRAEYTAVSNTIIGIVLLIGMLFGIIANQVGLAALFMLFVVMTLTAAIMGYRLQEVQQV